jgi:hypothetical protein
VAPDETVTWMSADQMRDRASRESEGEDLIAVGYQLAHTRVPIELVEQRHFGALDLVLDP